VSSIIVQHQFDKDTSKKRELIDLCLDEIRLKYGKNKVRKGIILKDKKLSSIPFDANKIHPVSYF